MVEVALEVIDPCEHAGIDVVHQRTITPVRPSSEIAEGIDGLQNDVDEGPCFSAIREHETFYSEDLAEEDRSPRFSSRAHEQFGVRSMLGFRLYTGEDTTGAINLYSSQLARSTGMPSRSGRCSPRTPGWLWPPPWSASS